MTPQEHDAETEARALFDESPIRETRWSTLPATGEVLLEALHGWAGTATVSNLLAEATPLCEYTDERWLPGAKTLRHWTRDDWQAALADQYDAAVRVLDRAREFDTTVSGIVGAMDRAGVHQTGDLFPSSHHGGAA